MKKLTLARFDKGGSDLTIADQTFGGTVSNWKPVGVARYVANQLGLITFEKGTMKDVRALAEVAGKSADDVKLARRNYDTGLAQFFQTSANIAALSVANPALRHTIKPKFGTKGNLLGVDHKARVFKAKATTETTRLSLEVAELKAKLAALETPAIAA